MTTFVDVVFDVSAILLLALLAMPLLRRSSAALRHWVLSTALTCAALAPVAEALLPEWRPPLPVALPSVVVPWSAQEVEADNAGSSPSAVAALAALPRAAWSSQSSGDWTITTVLLGVWLTGVVLSLTFLLLGLARLVQLTRRATPMLHPRWTGPIEHLRETFGIRRPVLVLESPRPNLLLVWGWRRPTIIVPASARAWSQARIDAVLRHELAHVKRGDWMGQLIAEIARAVYWFNPLVWLTCARLHVECERACDDAVLQAGVDASNYASDLVDIARDLRRRPLFVPAPAIVRVSTLERRVKAMLDRTVNRQPLSQRSRGGCVVLLLMVSVAVSAIAAAQQFTSLTGTIVDPTNGVLPGVTLVLTNEQTQAKYEIKSDRNGRYEFVGLPAGTYALESKLPGFAVFRSRVVVGGQPVQQDMTLSVGTLQETITIVGSDAPEPFDPDTERARAEQRAQEQRLAQFMEKRNAAAAKCASAPTSSPAMGGNIRVPVKLKDVKPRYPESQRGVEGTVVLSTVIDTEGRVSTANVVSATHQDFADSLIEAVRQWQFDGTLLNCTRIETQMTVTGYYRWK